MDATAELEKLSKYAKKQPLLRKKLQGPHSIVQLRVGHEMAQGQGIGLGEVPAVLETLDKLILSPTLGYLLSQASTTPASLGLLSMALHLVLLLGMFVFRIFSLRFQLSIRAALCLRIQV